MPDSGRFLHPGRSQAPVHIVLTVLFISRLRVPHEVKPMCHKTNLNFWLLGSYKSVSKVPGFVYLKKCRYLKTWMI